MPPDADKAGFFVLLDAINVGVATLQQAADADVETVMFPAGGGSRDMGLAIPRVEDMDEIVVDTAELTIHALEHPVTVDPAPFAWAADGVTPIDLPAPGRLVSIDLTFGGPLGVEERGTQRLVVSAGEKGADPVPIFAAPALGKAAPMLPAPLTGMSVTGMSGDARATFASPVAGQHWIVGVAAGDKVADLAPITAPSVAIRAVQVDASPTDLAITIPGAAGGGDAVLYTNPGTLLPSTEPHQVAFTPLAQRHLQAALEADATGPLLPVPIRLSSTSEGAVGVVSRTLVAHYRVRVPDASGLETGGSWATLPLVLPPQRRPTGGEGRIRGKLAGHELDPAFPPPAFVPPPTGLTVAPRRRIAVAASMQPGPTGTPVLAAARILASVARPAEVVLEVRRDVAGLPGDVLAAVVRKLPASEPAWHEFSLPAPIPLAATRVWCAVRTNDADVRWFGADSEPPVVSLDDGASWSTVDSPLGAPSTPLVQLFRPLADDAVPTLDIYLGATRVGSVALSRTPRDVAGPLALPPAVLDAVAATPAALGGGRVATPLRLYSPMVMTLSVADVACSYDPEG